MGRRDKAQPVKRPAVVTTADLVISHLINKLAQDEDLYIKFHKYRKKMEASLKTKYPVATEHFKIYVDAITVIVQRQLTAMDLWAVENYVAALQKAKNASLRPGILEKMANIVFKGGLVSWSRIFGMFEVISSTAAQFTNTDGVMHSKRILHWWIDFVDNGPPLSSGDTVMQWIEETGGWKSILTEARDQLPLPLQLPNINVRLPRDYQPFQSMPGSTSSVAKRIKVNINTTSKLVAPTTTSTATTLNFATTTTTGATTTTAGATTTAAGVTTTTTGATTTTAGATTTAAGATTTTAGVTTTTPTTTSTTDVTAATSTAINGAGTTTTSSTSAAITTCTTTATTTTVTDTATNTTIGTTTVASTCDAATTTATNTSDATTTTDTTTSAAITTTAAPRTISATDDAAISSFGTKLVRSFVWVRLERGNSTNFQKHLKEISISLALPGRSLDYLRHISAIDFIVSRQLTSMDRKYLIKSASPVDTPSLTTLKDMLRSIAGKVFISNVFTWSGIAVLFEWILEFYQNCVDLGIVEIGKSAVDSFADFLSSYYIGNSPANTLKSWIISKGGWIDLISQGKKQQKLQPHVVDPTDKLSPHYKPFTKFADITNIKQIRSQSGPSATRKTVYRCPRCKKTTEKRDTKFSMVQCPDRTCNAFWCPIVHCEFTSMSSADLQQHISNSHIPDPSKCQGCQGNKPRIGKIEILQCPIPFCGIFWCLKNNCKYEATTLSNIVKHQLAVHNIAAKEFRCLNCQGPKSRGDKNWSAPCPNPACKIMWCQFGQCSFESRNMRGINTHYSKRHGKQQRPGSEPNTCCCSKPKTRDGTQTMAQCPKCLAYWCLVGTCTLEFGTQEECEKHHDKGHRMASDK